MPKVDPMARRNDALRPPRISAPDLPPRLEPAQPRRGADLHACMITLDADADLAHSSLEQAVFGGSAESLDLRGATLMDVEFRDLRVASLSARQANLRRVRFTGGRIGTLDLADARIDEFELRGVRIDYLTFAGATAVDVLITDCRLTALDLPAARLTRTSFDGTRADEVDPRGMQAEHVDLRGLDALSLLDIASLRGTTMSLRQIELLAPAFAVAAGITVDD